MIPRHQRRRISTDFTNGAAVGVDRFRADQHHVRLTEQLAQTGVDAHADRHTGLFIPIGVAHGFAALTDATLTYIVNQNYDGGDEFGVAWDDPDLALPWGIESPILSGRDLRNPRLRDMPAEQLAK